MKKQDYKHIIWDWNGTLLYDVQECLVAVNRLLADRGLPALSYERYRDRVDFPIIDFYVELGFDFSREKYEDVAQEYMGLYLEQVPHCRLQENAGQILAALSERGYTQSVLSAYHQLRLVEAVNFFGLNDWFMKLIGLNDYYAHSKVDNGRWWIEAMPYARDEVLFVGDMRHDYQVARAMDVDCVLLACGHQSREVLETFGVPVLERLDDLIPWLDSGNRMPQ